ncbi:hypothetical protein EVAR_22789_1 [Eumeta japonica]|uniref:Uncharacterized protein n=1 Tax=Eumeta variegata TaxID=151549 RepID=A0A4C1VFD0_EUMVA|nr:hypothetical protein EVAR_22789_1 [Eumeta japonica]
MFIARTARPRTPARAACRARDELGGDPARLFGHSYRKPERRGRRAADAATSKRPPDHCLRGRKNEGPAARRGPLVADALSFDVARPPGATCLRFANVLVHANFRPRLCLRDHRINYILFNTDSLLATATSIGRSKSTPFQDWNGEQDPNQKREGLFIAAAAGAGRRAGGGGEFRGNVMGACCKTDPSVGERRAKGSIRWRLVTTV